MDTFQKPKAEVCPGLNRPVTAGHRGLGFKGLGLKGLGFRVQALASALRARNQEVTITPAHAHLDFMTYGP